MTKYERPKPLLDPRASHDELVRRLDDIIGRLDRVELMAAMLVDKIKAVVEYEDKP
jgi:hypothetical protein